MTVHRHRHGGCPTGLAAAARRRPSAPAPAETLPPSKQMKSKLFSTVTAEGAEQGIPSYFNNSRKQQQLHTAGVQGRGCGSTAPAPGCSHAGMGSGSWEEVCPAAPREAAQGVCPVWWESGTAVGGNQGQAPGNNRRARRGKFPTVTQINAEPTQPRLMPLSQELRSS